METSDILAAVAILFTVIGGILNFYNDKRIRKIEKKKNDLFFVFDDLLLKQVPASLYAICYGASTSQEENDKLQLMFIELKKVSFILYFYDKSLLTEIHNEIIMIDELLVWLPSSDNKELDIHKILGRVSKIYSLIYRS